MKYQLKHATPAKIYDINFDMDGFKAHLELISEFRERGIRMPHNAGTLVAPLYEGQRQIGVRTIFYLNLEVAEEYERRLLSKLEEAPVEGSQLPADRYVKGSGGAGGRNPPVDAAYVGVSGAGNMHISRLSGASVKTMQEGLMAEGGVIVGNQECQGGLSVSGIHSRK